MRTRRGQGSIGRRAAAARRWLGALAVVVAAASLTGCGYSLAGRGTFLPSYIKTVGIPTFTNHTSIFDVEQILTAKVRSEFIGRGNYTVTPTTTGVDAILTGTVNSITLTPASFTNQQQASRYVMTVVASIQFLDTHTNKVLWQNPSMTFQEDYEASSGTSALDPAAFFSQQTQALDRLATDFAQSVVSAILEAF
ncbi:MAG: LptE family protein [Acidobacteriota bacterium]|nr:LptE family protein [Acidobacteriota bacterium]